MTDKIAWKDVFKSWRHEDQAMWKGGRAGFKAGLEKNLHKTLIPKFLYKIYIGWRMLIWPITKRKIYKHKEPLRWNVYGINGAMGDYYRQWHNFHFTVKGKLVYPLIRLAKRLMRNYLLTKVPDEPHLRNLKVFERAFNSAVTEWFQYWMNPLNPARENKKMLQQKLEKYIFTDIKNIITTMATKDTAIFEFVNMLMFRIAKEMHKEYENKGLVKHVLYHSSSSFDYAYYLIQQTLCKNKEGKFKDVKITMERVPLPKMGEHK